MTDVAERLLAARLRLGEMLDKCRECTLCPPQNGVSQVRWCQENCDHPARMNEQLQVITGLQKEYRKQRSEERKWEGR